MYMTEVEFSGQNVDTVLLSRAIDAMANMDAKFSLREMRIGRTADAACYVRIEVGATDV